MTRFKRRWARSLLVACVITCFAGVAHALPVIIPDFAVDPSGAAFTIGPVSKFAPGSTNLAADPSLTFGVTSQPDGTTDTLQMSWDEETPGQEAQAGWELVFGADPDISNRTISLDINPPGGWGGAPGASPFAGILSVEVRALDMGGNLAGGWGFNTDQAGLLPVGPDPLASGGISLFNNIMNNVVINVGAGPAAGSALVNGITGPNYLIGGNNNWTQILTIQFFENGVMQGGLTVIPGQTTPNLLNYWTNITVTPEPTSLVLLGTCGLMLLAGRKNR